MPEALPPGSPLRFGFDTGTPYSRLGDTVGMQGFVAPGSLSRVCTRCDIHPPHFAPSGKPIPNPALSPLQSLLESLVEKDLLQKYRAIDPNLKWGYTGSFKTGVVGNPQKPTVGQPIDLTKFDVDFWIESDILYKKFGPNLRADVEFRKILSKTPGFEGLKPNKEGFSILFKPSKCE